MEILRNNTNTDLELLTTVDYDDAASALITDMNTGTEYEIEIGYILQGTGDKASVLLPAVFNQYDIDGYAIVYNVSEDVIYETGFSTVRPYTDIPAIATSLSITEAEAIYFERIARYLIDSKTGGFKFVYKSKEVLGLGSDMLLIDERINKLFKLYENEELVFELGSPDNEFEYFLNKSKTAILRETEENDENRIHYKKVWKDRYAGTEFREDFDYIVEGEFGYYTIPYEIKEATDLLIQDLSCGNNRYLNKYIQSINTDGYDIRYFDESLFGTGNLIVDNILTKYGRNIRARVL
jgi:hypothetical protein